jgi:hypothetical protein
MMDHYLAELDALGCVIAVTADHGMNAEDAPRCEPERDLPAGSAGRAGWAPAARA